MAHLPMYLAKEDVPSVLAWVNDEPSLAYIIRPEVGRLIALRSTGSLVDGNYLLWHTEIGPIPYYRRLRRWFRWIEVVDTVPDPFEGWEESIVGGNGQPWFGTDNRAFFNLDIFTESRERPDGIGLSSVSWIGGHYSSLGRPASESTTRVWKRLRSWVSRHAKRVPRVGPVDGYDAEVYAFPEAYSRIEAGCWHDRNPGI